MLRVHFVCVCMSMNHLRCPLCHASFTANAQGLVCINRHQFDRAREGYYHLLPVQFKGSREPGDAKSQLQARRCFLRADFFASLKQLLATLLPASTTSLLDIGCGEGYFTSALADVVPGAATYGLDVSKVGIQLAAKAALHRNVNDKHGLACSALTYLVASSADLPFKDASLDVVTRIYAPSRDEELLRVLKPGGLLIVVTPGHFHWLGLRQKIYAQVRPHPAPHSLPGFESVAAHELQYDVSIPAGPLTEALLAMTPFSWRIQDEVRAQVIADGLTDTCHFCVQLYRPQ